MKLNALLKTLGFLALAATPVVAGPSAPAPKNPIAPAPVNDDLGITASIGYDTSYVWRGLNFGSHWVRAGLNGSLLLVGGAAEDGAGSTSLLWDAQYGSLAGDQDHFMPGGAGNASFQRLQLGAALSHDFGPASVNLGYRYYRNMGGLSTAGRMNDGQEVSLGLATALGPINLTTSGNYDFVNNYWYFDLNASSTIAVTDAISIVPYATIGFGHNMNWQFAGSNGSGVTSQWTHNNVSSWTAVTTGIQVPIKLNSRATLTPYIAVNIPMSGIQNLPLSGTPSSAYSSVLFGGVTLSVRF
ncbi:MAG: hypothetical protein B7Z37_24485 [Verrucomicrobia bacterium 12-59-8]|nr:MAG: hypothetical protein B7Z37_24485 [Verrucomicrobia bacterium 12-59-8]